MQLISCSWMFVFLFCLSVHGYANGKLIIFTGLSGSGKSSLAKEVAKRSNALCFLEPEEQKWPDYVQEKQDYGEFSSLMTIRAIRVHSLWNAWKAREAGSLVFVDTYYDKINAYCVGKPGMEWLIDPKDPYFPIALEVLRLDNEILPNADLIVLLDISYDDWIKMLNVRHRAKDFIEGFQDSYLLAKRYLFEALNKLSIEKNIPFIVFQQKFSSIEEQADLLCQVLEKEKIILKK